MAGEGIPQIDICLRQEKECRICGRRFHASASHTTDRQHKDNIPRILDSMEKIIQKEPHFQVCDNCRNAIQNPKYEIKES